MKRTVLLISLGLMAIASLPYLSAFAQSKPAPASAQSDSEVLREILNEVRLLRAELVRLNVNAQRMQALLDRMKMQQDQAGRLTHELGNTRDELSAIRNKQDRLKEALEAAEKRFAAGVAGDNEIKALTAELKSLREREQLLMGREPLLSAQLNSTMATLTELNARLDELEREIAAPAPGQERPQKKN